MAQRSPPLELILERDWRLADERARLLAPLAEAPTCSVADIDRVARQLKLDAQPPLLSMDATGGGGT
jgi:hypothetical protein